MPRSRRPGGRGRRKADAPHPVDIYVGARVKERRTELGISQEKLAEALGLTFQQVQKYERAANRISASRLYRMGMTLGVDVPFFFEGYHEAGVGSGFAEPPAAGFESDPLQARCGVETMATTNRVVLAGETRGPSSITGEMLIDVARHAIRDIGYEQEGFHWQRAQIECFIHPQSSDIAQGVDASGNKDEGAG